jgi:DNA-directed RNA polymerase subunit G
MPEQEEIVKFTGTVEDIEKELIPRLFIARIRSDDSEYIVEMDMHKDLILFNKGSRVEVVLSRATPSYKDGIDFVGVGTVVSKRKEDDTTAFLISIGGLLFKIKSRKELSLEPTERIYVKVAPLS